MKKFKEFLEERFTVFGVKSNGWDNIGSFKTEEEGKGKAKELRGSNHNPYESIALYDNKRRKVIHQNGKSC